MAIEPDVQNSTHTVVTRPAAAEAVQPPSGPEPALSALGTSLPNPSVGMNLAPITDWSTEYPFIDLMRTAREWIAHRPGEWGGVAQSALAAVQDANGWPTAMPAGASHLTTMVLSELPAAMTSAAGRYRLTYTGRGKIEIWGNARNIAASAGTIRFDHVPTGGGSVFIDIKEIDPTSPIRITGIVNERHAAAFDAGEVFNPEWLALIRDFRVLRFMNWSKTNNSTESAWSDRPRRGDYTWQRRGIPLEIMVRLANHIGADPWFCLPHLATADYMTRFTTLVLDRLNPRLKAHFEYSNEVWNWMFRQADWCNAEAQKLWPGYGEGWVEYYAHKSVQMARIVDAVYGAEKHRAVKVLGMHTGWQGLEYQILNGTRWRQTFNQAQPPSAYFDAYAVTGYFGSDLGNENGGRVTMGWLDQYGEAGALDRAFSALGSSVTGLLSTWRYHKAAADKAGLKLVMYEGGSHVVGLGQWQENARLTAFFAKLHRDPRFGPLYTRMLANWRDVGGGANALFDDIEGHSKYGPWGHLEHINDQSVRWDALTDFNRANPAWWEERAPSAFLGRSASA